MGIWFTADTHFGHTNIIEKCGRPFMDRDHHDDELIERLNCEVGEGDTLYHLGDFALPHSYNVPNAQQLAITGYRNRIRCRNVILIMGNHDPHYSTGQPKDWMRGLFTEIHMLLHLRAHHEGVTHRLVLCHYGLETWNRSHHGAIMLHGHSHGGLAARPNRFDMGVDCNGFRPVSLATVLQKVTSCPTRSS